MNLTHIARFPAAMKLGRLIVGVGLFFLLGPRASAEPIKEGDIIDTWHLETNLGFEEITFTADHHWSAITGGITQGKLAGTWRFEDGVLIKKWTSGESTFAGKKQAADGSETKEKAIELKDDTLRTEVPGQYHYYKRGPLPEDFKKVTK